MWKIYGILIVVMFFWGLNLPIVKFLVSEVQPVTVTGFRIFLAGMTVFSILFLFRLVRLPSRREWRFVLLGALLNVVVHHYCLSIGLSLTSATNAGLILGTGPMLTAVLVSLILRSYPSRLQWIGVAIGLAGVTLTVLAGGGAASGMSGGDALVFLSILGQVLSFIVISKAAKTLDPRLLTAYMLTIGGLTLFLISLVQEPGAIAEFAAVPPLFWPAFAVSAMLSTAVGHMLYNHSVGKAGPSKAAIFMNLNTLFSVLFSALLLGEIITSKHLGGLVLIIVGVIFGSGAAEDLWLKRKKRRIA